MNVRRPGGPTAEPVGPNTPGICGSVSGSGIGFDGAH